MDKISIALMGKIAQVYENRYKDCWLTMNRLPQIFDVEDFDFPMLNSKASIEETERRIDNQCNFSILVDEIPVQNLYYQSTGRRLSDTYSEIINQLTPISFEIDVKRQSRIAELEELLKSEKYETYRTWQEKYDTIKIEVNNLIAAIKNADAANSQFKDAQKTLYENKGEEQASIKRKWIAEGYKNDIERAIHEKAALQSQGFYPDWQEKLFDFEMAKISRINSNLEYYETAYTPSQIVKEKSGWSEVSLNNQEIESLFHTMSEKLSLKNRSKISHNSLNIKNLKAKFANLIIHRPWFEDGLFENKFWKLPDYFDKVSDGDDPADGLIPNYLYSMLIVKDVRINLEESVHNLDIIEKDTLQTMNIGPLLMMKPQMMESTLQLKSVEKVDAKLMKGSLADLNPKFMMPKQNPQNLLKEKIIRKSLALAKEKFDAKSISPAVKYKSSIYNPIEATDQTFIVQGNIESNTGEQLRIIEIIFYNLENNTQISRISIDGGFQQKLPHFNYEIHINQPDYHPLKTKIKNQSGPQKFILNKIVQPQNVTIEEQFKGILVFGYLCKKVPKSPNPLPQ